MKNNVEDRYKGTYLEETQSHIVKDAKTYMHLGALSEFNYFEGIDISGKVLEFGCGLGQNIAFLKNAHGFDVSPFSLKFCQSKGIQMYDDMKNIPDNFFDVILSSHCLEHIPDPLANLVFLRKKLKNMGILVLILPVESTPGARYEGNPFKNDPDNHLYCWNFRTINNLLESAHFKVLKNELISTAAYSFWTHFNFSRKTYAQLTRVFGSLPLINKKKEMKIVCSTND